METEQQNANFESGQQANTKFAVQNGIENFSGILGQQPLIIRISSALYVLSLIGTFIAIFFAVSDSQMIGAAGSFVLAILIANLFLIAFFCFLLWKRFSNSLPHENTPSVGTKIHVRYIRIFMAAAAIPSVIIALFAGLTVGRGVQAWLSGQVRDNIAATTEFGRQSLNQIGDSVRTDIVAMSSDLDAAAVQLNADKSRFQSYLGEQADRRGFVAAYIINQNNEIIAQALRPDGAPVRANISIENFATADAGEVSVYIDENVIANGLFRLNKFDNLYLQVVRLTPDDKVKLIKQAEQVISSYRTIETRQAQVQTVFALGFAETALLIIIGAGWLGLSSATRISYPIAQLASAAQRIRSGDYSARVVPDFKVHELSALTNTFNEMTQDLGDQKLALEQSKEEALTRSAFIQAVLDGVSAGVISLDCDFNIKAVNGSASRLLGVPQSELLNNNLANIAPDFMDIARKTRPNYLAKGHIEREKGNNLLVFDVKSTFAGDDIVLTFDEVSSQIASQRQAAWRDVARRIAHEIKNPLTPIQLSAERIARKFGPQIETDKELFKNLTKTIVRQVTDIGRMVDEFSSFARMPTPKFTVEDICTIIRETVFSQKIAFPTIEYSLQSPPEAILVSMDSRLISQAILNILKNAAESVLHYQAQFTNIDTQKEPPVIAIMSEIDNTQIRILIEDNGIGFPKQDRARLLEPYVTTRAKGTGLGLAIVARIFEEHGGEIKLCDRDDDKRGAIVELILPIATNEKPNNQGAQHAI